MSTSELWSIETAAKGVGSTQGVVDSIKINQVKRGLDRVLRCHHIDEPARVRLTGPPCSDGPMLAQANVMFRNRPVRVQVPGPSGFIATFLADRLERQFARFARNIIARF